MNLRVFLPLLSLLLCFSAHAATVRGVVLDAAGQPLPDLPLQIVETSDEKQLPPRELKTDAKGAFSLEIDGLGEERDRGERRSVTALIFAPTLAAQATALQAGDNQIRLQSAKKWGGVVFDEAQKPVAGAQLRLKRWHNAQSKHGSEFPSSLAPRAVSDENGRYVFDNVPQQGRVTLESGDARFQNASFDLDLGAEAAPPLFVKRGANLAGRMLSPDGAPLGGVAFFDTGNFTNFQFSAADGTFSIQGLKPGAAQLHALPRATEWILAPLAVENLRAGETKTLDWIAKRGVEVSGQVVDAATKKPLEGAAIEVYGASGSNNGKSDAQGRFKIRVDGLRHAQFGAPGYLSKSLFQFALAPDAASHDVGTITLERGATVRGTVRDEAGQPVPFFQLQLKARREDDEGYLFGSNGQISADGATKAGTYTLSSDDFEVVSPKTLVVPAPDAPFAPLEIVLRAKNPVRSAPLLGRVVTDKGEPIAGATVTFKVNDWDPQSVISGLDGRFEVAKSELGAQKPSFGGVERAGFVFSSGGDIVDEGGAWRVADIVMAPRGSALTARLIDENGAPLSGAWVAVLGDRKRAPLQSGADGGVRLEDLPAREVQLIAAHGARFGRFTARGDAQNLGWKLAPPAPAEDDAALAEEILGGKVDFGELRKHGDVIGSARLERAALRADGALDAQGQPLAGRAGWNLLQFVGALSQRDPQALLERGPQLISAFKTGDQKWDAEAIVALVGAKSKHEAARDAAQTWFEREKVVKREANVENVGKTLRLANVARALGRDDAAAWLDLAVTMALGQSDKTRLDGADYWGSLIAHSGASAVEALAEEFNTPQKLAVWSGAVRTFARNGDGPSARRGLSLLEAGQNDDAVRAQNQNRTPFFNAGDLLRRAQSEVVKFLAPRDPQGALQLAQKMANDYQRAEALLVVGAAALPAGQNEVAARALRAVFETENGGFISGAQAAALAASFDAELGQELFEKARLFAEPLHDSSYAASIASWAFYHAPQDGALSRILLEREWEWRLPAAKLEKEGDSGSNGAALGQLAWAMSALDGRRALEWAAFAPAKWGVVGRAKARIAAVLLSDAKARQSFDVEGE